MRDGFATPTGGGTAAAPKLAAARALDGRPVTRAVFVVDRLINLVTR